MRHNSTVHRVLGHVFLQVLVMDDSDLDETGNIFKVNKLKSLSPCAIPKPRESIEKRNTCDKIKHSTFGKSPIKEKSSSQAAFLYMVCQMGWLALADSSFRNYKFSTRTWHLQEDLGYPFRGKKDLSQKTKMVFVQWRFQNGTSCAKMICRVQNIFLRK